MITSGITVNVQRPNEKTRQPEWRETDIIDISDEEFAHYWLSITDDKDKFFVVNTLRRCLIGLSDFQDQAEA